MFAAPFSRNSVDRELGKDQVHLNVDRDKQSGDSKVDRTVGGSKVNSLPSRLEEKPGSSETRPKEGITIHLVLYFLYHIL